MVPTFPVRGIHPSELVVRFSGMTCREMFFLCHATS